MIRPRSERDRERIDYEGSKAVSMLMLEAIRFRVNGEHEKATARSRVARDLKRALKGQKTGFDTMGGRGEWILEQKKGAANG